METLGWRRVRSHSCVKPRCLPLPTTMLASPWKLMIRVLRPRTLHVGGCVLTMLSCVWCSYTIVAKPHGHGDVHGLLLKHDLVRQWSADGRRYVVFFQVCQRDNVCGGILLRVHTVCAQDTNALCFDTIPAAIGASVMHGFDVCGSGVPRVPIAVTLCVSVCGHR